MKISKNDFISVSSELKIPHEKAEAQWAALEKLSAEGNSLAISRLFFYFGALIVIAAMTWFMEIGWNLFGGDGKFLISAAYIFFLGFVGARLWYKKDMRVPAGLLVTIAVSMVPMAIYGIQEFFGFWPKEHPGAYRDFFHWVKEGWLFMEVGTIIAGLIALRFFPFPFLTAPIFCAAWLLSLDVVPLLIGQEQNLRSQNWITLCFGLLLIVIGYLIDRYKKQDFAFWSYFFGTISFWVSLTYLAWDSNETFFFVYFLINLSMMILSILLQRRIMLVFGAFGVFTYVSHLAFEVFEDVVLFPFALSLVGLATIYLGIVYQRNSEWIEQKVKSLVPHALRRFLPFQ